MKGYKILYSFNADDLNTEIADHMRQGWVPSGNLRCAAVGGGSSCVKVFQAMKLEDTTAE